MSYQGWCQAHRDTSLSRRARSRGAALSEYLPPLSVAVLVGVIGYQQYAPVIKEHVGKMATQIASNYYQGWFYPKTTPGLAPMGGTSPYSPPASSPGSSGPAFGPLQTGSSSGTAGTPGTTGTPNTTGGSGGSNPFLPGTQWGGNRSPVGPGSGFVNPGGSGTGGSQGQSCQASSSSSSTASSSVASAASTHTLFGNPIDIGNGNKYQWEPDFIDTGTDPLVFYRYYNSIQRNDRTALGYGWRHSYQRQLTISETQPDQVQMVRDDGSAFFYTREGEHWVPLGAVADRLDATDTGWRYHTVQGAIETYTPEGRLQQIDYPSGVVHTLTYTNGQLTQVADSRGRAITFAVQHGRVRHVTLPSQELIRFAYDDYGNLARYQRTQTGWWSQLLSAFTHASTTYHYEAPGLPHSLTGITDAQGQRYATWGYDDLGRATLSHHGEGVEQLTITYQADGTVSLVNAAGLSTHYTLEPARPGYRRVVRIEGDATPSCPATGVDLTYNPQGFLAFTVDAEGSGQQFARNARGLITQHTQGLVRNDNTWQPSDGALRTDTTWHPDLPLATQVHYRRYHQGHWQAYLVNDYAYDPHGRLRTHTATDLSPQTEPYATQGTQRTWTYSYTLNPDTQQPQQLRVNGPREPRANGQDDITTYQFNPQGLLTHITNPLGQTTHIRHYNAQGNPIEAILANGIHLQLTYDRHGHLDTLTREAGDLTETIDVDIDRNGLLTQLTQADGSRQHFTYNAARQLTEVTNHWGDTLRITPSPVSGQWRAQTVYDRNGLPVRQFDRQMDSLGRVLAVLGQYGQQTAIRYNKVGQLRSLQEQGNDQPTQHQYDALHRLTHTLDALQGSTHIDYSLQGQIAQVTDAEGNITRFAYNGFGDVIMLQSPDTGVLIHHYDSAGNKIQTQGGPTLDAAQASTQATAYRYDLANRLTMIDYPGHGHDVTYTYDSTDAAHGQGIGQLTHISDASGTTDYTYDPLGRLINDTRRFTLNGQTTVFSVGYHYTKHGLLDHIQLPNGARQQFEYDDGRISGINYHSPQGRQTVIDDVAYALGHTPATWRYGNGLAYQQTYDRNGRLRTQQLTHGQQKTPLWSQQYQYDQRNQIEQIDTLASATEFSTRYRYDALARLVAEGGEDAAYPTRAYRYDAVGNRLKQRFTLKDQSVDLGADYAAENSHLQRFGHTQLLVSDNGNTLMELHPQRDRRYVYNQTNQLVAVYSSQQLSATYAYNSLGQRVHKLAITAQGLQHTVFHYTQDGRLLGETLWSPEYGIQASRYYLWWQRHPVAMVEENGDQPPTITYLHTDHLNTPRLATDANHTVVWQWQSDAFGVGLPDEDPDGDGTLTTLNLRFAGQYFDAESGLHYNVHRYYNPETGRYTQSDPIGLMGGVNTYAYAMANPVANTDPWGLFLFAFDGTGNDSEKLGGFNANAVTNVALFRDYYKAGYSKDDYFYRAGVGTAGWVDYVVGGATGLGSRQRINDALDQLDTLLNDNSWDRVIDIVGFSRGAAAAREFANDVFERIDNNYWGNQVTQCNSLNIRFMGLFDTVGSMGIAGNSTNIGYDFTLDPRIGQVAQAVALNEHRPLFPLSSVSPVAGASITSGNVVEQGFIGAHSDIGGGYADSDLSDVALQWMYQQAVNAGVNLGSLKAEHQRVRNPVIHDERKLASDWLNSDRAIFYPNDPFNKSGRQCERRYKGKCVQWSAFNPAERMRTAPQFPDLSSMINEGANGSQRGTVDMNQYRQWLQQNVNITVD